MKGKLKGLVVLKFEFGEDAQARTPLLEALQQCTERSDAPFYTPGHKRGQGISQRLRDCLGAAVFRADLPELPELDNLFAPEGAIQAAQMLAAEAFGAEQTWFLTNGSTSGVIAAIVATCQAGDPIILPRNSHQSAISALVLSGAVPIFVNPEYDPLLDIAHSITPEAVATALSKHPNAKAVMMVSPTYYGVCGDVQAIAQLAHNHGIPLLVDEAHGAHFAFHPELPRSALNAGADLTIQSTHKTLSAMTQAAMLHVQGNRIDRDRIRKALQLVQSTSPSYLLLASLDAARYQMATQGKQLLQHTLDLADSSRTRLQEIPGLSTLELNQAGAPGFFDLDRTRLTVTVSELGISGFQADELLQQHCVIAELPSLRNLTLIISLGNTETDIDRLVTAFATLATRFNQAPCAIPASWLAPLPVHRLTPRQAFFADTETRTLSQTVRQISAELVCPYPPGIPVLMPGEEITQEAIDYLQQVLNAGGVVSGCADTSLEFLQVVKGRD